MNMLILCLIVIAGAQGWERPVITEAELTAPETPQQQPPPQTSDNATGTNELSWDMDTPSLEESPKETADQQLYWEYDDDGQPVARPATDVQQPAPPQKSEAEPPQQQPQPQAHPKPAQQEPSGRHAGRIATFWMVLPPR